MYQVNEKLTIAWEIRHPFHEACIGNCDALHRYCVDHWAHWWWWFTSDHLEGEWFVNIANIIIITSKIQYYFIRNIYINLRRKNTLVQPAGLSTWHHLWNESRKKIQVNLLIDLTGINFSILTLKRDPTLVLLPPSTGSDPETRFHQSKFKLEIRAHTCSGDCARTALSVAWVDTGKEDISGI